MFVKYITETAIASAPEVYVDGKVVITNFTNSPALLKKYGFKELVESDKPETKFYEHLEVRYVNEDEFVLKTYEIVKDDINRIKLVVNPNDYARSTAYKAAITEDGSLRYEENPVDFSTLSESSRKAIKEIIAFIVNYGEHDWVATIGIARKVENNSIVAEFNITYDPVDGKVVDSKIEQMVLPECALIIWTELFGEYEEISR